MLDNLRSFNVAELECLLPSDPSMQILRNQVLHIDVYVGTLSSPTGATSTMQISRTPRTTLATSKMNNHFSSVTFLTSDVK